MYPHYKSYVTTSGDFIPTADSSEEKSEKN